MVMKNEDIFKIVESIQFELLSPTKIKKMAAVKVVTPELYDKEGYPVDGGLMDTRMGVITPGLRCRTCGGYLGECQGHFGYIEFARPVIHVKFAPYIYLFLKYTCPSCGRVLLTKDQIEEAKKLYHSILEIEGPVMARKKVLDYLKTHVNTKQCPHCSTKIPKIKLDKPYTFYENDRLMNPIEIRARLEKVPDEDLFLFGLDPSNARPEWMILTVLPVPPVTVRPSLTLETGERSEDDLTHKLGEIVRINQRLFENINAGAPEVLIDDLWDLLQFHVATYFDNTISQLPVSKLRGGNVAVKSLVERIKSKTGRIRLNLLGKRVNFSARSVISPDPMLKINEVGVPIEVAKVLTVQEHVTEWNIDYLKKYVMNGPNKYPGANYVIRPDGRRKMITAETKEQILEELQPGYIVERHLIDGDIALFNRQPSLHKHSMMALFVKVLPGKTFRINPAVCYPYNADFDGDEMNLHIPQTIEAQTEAIMLMEVSKLLVTPKNGEVIIGASADSITGNYILTKYMKLSKKEATDLLLSAGVMDLSRLEDKEIYEGKELYSVIFPADFNFEDEGKNGKIVIKNGKIIEGVLDKSLLGAGSGKLIRKLYSYYGYEVTAKIIEYIFRLGLKVITKFGFSIALKDVDIPKEIEQQIQNMLKDTDKKVAELIHQYHEGKIEPDPGKTIEETLDLRIQAILDQVRTDIGELIAKNTIEEKSIITMFKSGGKGSLLNLAQISGIVGQQSLRGKRIDFGYRNRSLSHYKEKDLMPESRGFIKSNFRKGLKPQELFFQAITGRDGLMDTALRTPKSGYLYRRLSSNMLDYHIAYDGTVRNGDNTIIQFIYGSDGLDISKTESGKLNIKAIINEVIAEEKSKNKSK